MKLKSLVALAAVIGSLVAVGSASAATAELFWSGGAGTILSDVAVDSSGNVYATYDTKVAKITSAGTATAAWANLGAGNYAYDISAGPSGSMVVQSGYTGIKLFDASGSNTYSYSGITGLSRVTVDGSGNVWWVAGQSAQKSLGKIPAGTASGAAPTPKTLADTPCDVTNDSAGDAYVGTGSSSVQKFTGATFTSSSTANATYTVGPGTNNDCAVASGATYIYVARYSSNQGLIDRIQIATGTVNVGWATLPMGSNPRSIAVGPDGSIYTANQVSGMGSPTGSVSKITSAGVVTSLVTLATQPAGIAVDSSSNVYVGLMGSMGGPSSTPGGVYKIADGTSTPAATTTTTTPTTTSTAPTPGPALKVTSIPAEITVDIAPSTNGETQEITAEIPCTAPEGQSLARCSVKMTAPEAVLLGQGDGIKVRSDKKVTIGQATVKSKSGKKVIVVKVKINQKGRKALKINTKITATIGLTAVTVSNQRSTGSTTSEMRLPTQLLSPTAGIFDSNSIELNKAGVAFVNRLAALLPSKPQAITCIGFADNTGVPGDNRWLGDRRAKAVCSALEAKGIVAKETSIETKAATSPRADNATAAGRAQNRRVSIRITY